MLVNSAAIEFMIDLNLTASRLRISFVAQCRTAGIGFGGCPADLFTGSIEAEFYGWVLLAVMR